MSIGKAFLNRQIIVLLEHMGVTRENFLQLQNRARLDISMALLENQKVKSEQYFDLGKIQSAGIQLTKEPFARSLLLLQARAR